MRVKGRIVDFLADRDEMGYAVFVFKSDSDRTHPRFRAVCTGNLPDVVPGVPLLITFMAETAAQIHTADTRDLQEFEWLDESEKECLLNHVTDISIDYQDEDYALQVLSQVKWIARKTAERIIDAVNGDLYQLADKWADSAFWQSIPGSKRYLPSLQEQIGELLSMADLFKRYSRYGIGYPQIEKLSALYGTEAEAKLRANPYTVLLQLDLPFQVADYLARDLEIGHLDDRRIRAIIRSVLYQNEVNGNTCMSRFAFYSACERLHKGSAWQDCVVSQDDILQVVTQMDSVNYEDGLAGRVGFIKTWRMETEIGYNLQRLMQAPSALHTQDSVFAEIADKYNAEQMQFLRAFDAESVILLLGRGGTGKTHTIRGAIDLFKRRHPRDVIKLCAPTARAAGVLAEHSGHSASTIHILLGLTPYSMLDDDIQQLDAGLIVVDEMSMVDTELMSLLLRAIKSGAKVILSGDPDQLESVGCGAVLRDLVRSGVVPQVTLQKIMRQGEGSAIIENCDRILSGRAQFAENAYFKVRQCQTDAEAMAYLKSCYSGDSHSTQILTTTNRGIVGTAAINNIFTDPTQEGIWVHHEHFKVGDKVIFTQNNYGAGYCNGDIGFIESAAVPVRIRKQGDNQVIYIEKEDLVDIEHADAITIHKSQGSEYQKVYIILPEDPHVMLTRNIVNTAISRARQDVVLIVVGNALRVAVSDRFKRYRMTMLESILHNLPDTLSGVQNQ